MYSSIVPFLFFILFIVLLLFIVLRKKGKHSYNIKQSKNILVKLKDFEFDGARINYLKKIDHFIFEELILTAFEKKGFSIKRNKKYTGDGGVDGIIFDGRNRKYLIQCKRYSSYVNRQDIIDFKNFVDAKNIHGGFFCHTGKTGKATYGFFAGTKVEILSGSRLLKLIG